MNKHYKSFITRHNLTNSGENFTGSINGIQFTFNFCYLRQPSPLVFKTDFYSDDETRATIINELKSLKIKYLIIEDGGIGLILGYNHALTANRMFLNVDQCINKITDCIKKYITIENEICPSCGKNMDNSKLLINPNGFNINICEECYNQAINDFKEIEEDYHNHDFAIIKPVLGALGGALISAVLFIIIYMFGFIGAISGYVAVYLGSRFYLKFNGKPDYKMVIIVCLLSLVVLCSTVFGLYYMIANTEPYNVAIDGLENFKNMMKDKEISSAFTSDMLMTVLFTLLALVFSIKPLINSTKRTEKSILELNK